MPVTKTKLISARVTPQEFARIKATAKAEDRRISDLLRDALRRALETTPAAAA